MRPPQRSGFGAVTLEGLHVWFMLVRFYLFLAGCFEVYALQQTLTKGALRVSQSLRALIGPKDAAALLQSHGKARGLNALWSWFLFVLCVSRFILASDVYNVSLFALVALVHVAEAALLAVARAPGQWHWNAVGALAQAGFLSISFILVIFVQ